MTRTAEDFLRGRRSRVAAHPSQIGLDFVEVVPAPAGASPSDTGPHRLVLHFIPAQADPSPSKHTGLGDLTAENLRFKAAGVPVDGLFEVRRVEHLTPASTVVTATVAFAGDADLARRLGSETVFTLELTGVPHLDPFFARVDFSLNPEAPRGEDCADACPPAAVEPSPLASDYLAKDFASFRQRMLDSLAGSLPEWGERSPADLMVTLVELLSDAADQASYYQDAVATEAYLGTARLRTSVRRHARLVGYTVQEGTNARVWACFSATANGDLPAGTQLLTRVPGSERILVPGSDLVQAMAAAPLVFETLHPVRLRTAHNSLPLYDWGAPEIGLPRGATAATLRGSFPDLATGDVLILEETGGPETGRVEDADPERRHAVRLTRVSPGSDPLGDSGPVALTEIEWHPGDALPFPLRIATVVDGVQVTDLAAVRGNVGLADHGRTVGSDETLTATAGRFRPRLARRGLTHRVPYEPAAAGSATADLAQDPAQALPALELREGAAVWTLKRDLLASGRFARDFVVEMENDGTAVLRFGDGALGLPPEAGAELRPRYRVGNGRTGNIGRDSLWHVVVADPDLPVAAVRNPLPARGGTDPEPLDRVRLAAPGALRSLEGRTSERDFARLAETHPEVERAAASLRWTGSWYVLEVAVQRPGGAPADPGFLGRVRAFLEDWRLGGWEIAVRELRFVGLDIAVTAVLDGDTPRGAVERALLETFSNRDLADGGRGFFHPDNFTFGQPVYLSRIVQAALRVPGVRAVDTSDAPPRLNRFRRFGEPPRGELAAGQIRLGRAEIARVDNDLAAPRNGRIQFYLEGGR